MSFDDGNDRLVYKLLDVIHETAAGARLHVEDAGGNDVIEWFPKSQVDYGNIDMHDEEVVILRWIALDKGLGKPLREMT